MKPSDYKYFDIAGGEFVGIISNNKEGALFHPEGTIYMGEFMHCYRIACCHALRFHECSFEEFIKYFTENGRKVFLEKMQFNLKPVRLTKQKIHNLLDVLKQEGAINGDTAYLAKRGEYDYLNKMAKDKLIFVSPLKNDMFYLKEKNVDKLS